MSNNKVLRTTQTNTRYSAAFAAAVSYISICQSTAQGLISSQSLSVNCGNTISDIVSEDGRTPYGKQTACLSCIENLTEAVSKIPPGKKSYTNEEIRELCANMCECRINDITVNQNVYLNTDAFKKSDISETFSQRFKDNVKQQIINDKKSSGSNILTADTESDQFAQQISILEDNMKSDSFAESIQALNAYQSINVKGAVNLNGINLAQATELISTIIQTHESTMDTINTLDREMLQATTEIAEQGIMTLAFIIIQVIFLIIVIILLYYIVQVATQVFGTIIL